MNCLCESTLRAYRDGELDPVERSKVENHMADCPQCRRHLEEIAAAAGRVEERLLSLDATALEAPVDPQIALARFKGQHGAGEERIPFFGRLFARRWRPAWVTGVAAVFVLCGLAFPSGRSLAQRFLATLRVEKVQPVRLDLSTLDGNRPLQEMLGKMISDKIVVTADEKPQHPATVTEASQLAGFTVHLFGERRDTPQFVVEGEHAFHMAIDRARLQDIFDQSGRPDLLLPATRRRRLRADPTFRAHAVWRLPAREQRGRARDAKHGSTQQLHGPRRSTQPGGERSIRSQSPAARGNRPAACWNERDAGPGVLPDDRLEINPCPSNSTLRRLLQCGGSEWSAGHADQRIGPPRTGLRVDLGEKWHDLLSRWSWRLERSLDAGEFARLTPGGAPGSTRKLCDSNAQPAQSIWK